MQAEGSKALCLYEVTDSLNRRTNAEYMLLVQLDRYSENLYTQDR